MTVSKFQTENPQILDATLQNLIAMATGATGFVYPCFINRINMLSLNNLSKMKEKYIGGKIWERNEFLGLLD